MLVILENGISFDIESCPQFFGFVDNKEDGFWGLRVYRGWSVDVKGVCKFNIHLNTDTREVSIISDDIGCKLWDAYITRTGEEDDNSFIGLIGRVAKSFLESPSFGTYKKAYDLKKLSIA